MKKKDKTIKILFISPIPPPYYGSALSSKKCLEILEDSSEFDVKGIKLNDSKSMDDVGKINFNKILGFFRVRKEIKTLISSYNPRAIYFVPATYGIALIRESLLIMMIRKFFKKPLVLHIRSRITEQHRSNPLNRFCYRKILKNNKVIVLHKSLIPDLGGLIKPENIMVLANAVKNTVSDSEILHFQNQRKISGPLNLLYLSHLDPLKGYRNALDTCFLLEEKGIDFIFHFVGDWRESSDKKKTLALLKEKGLTKKVFFHGMKLGREKDNFLKTADILVYPSTLDTYPRVILEGMMFGLPIIANGIGGIKDAVTDQKTGLILKTNTPEEIAESIIKLTDISKRQKMRSLGRKKFTEEYTIEKYQKNFIRTLLQLI